MMGLLVLPYDDPLYSSGESPNGVFMGVTKPSGSHSIKNRLAVVKLGATPFLFLKISQFVMPVVYHLRT